MSIQGPQDLTPEQQQQLLMEMLESLMEPVKAPPSSQTLALFDRLFIPPDLKKESHHSEGKGHKTRPTFAHTVQLLAKLLPEHVQIPLALEIEEAAAPKDLKLPLNRPKVVSSSTKEAAATPMKGEGVTQKEKQGAQSVEMRTPVQKESSPLSPHQVRLALQLLAIWVVPNGKLKGNADLDRLKSIVHDLIQTIGRKEMGSSDRSPFPYAAEVESGVGEGVKKVFPLPFGKEKTPPQQSPRLREKYTITSTKSAHQMESREGKAPLRESNVEKPVKKEVISKEAQKEKEVKPGEETKRQGEAPNIEKPSPKVADIILPVVKESILNPPLVKEASVTQPPSKPLLEEGKVFNTPEGLKPSENVPKKDKVVTMTSSPVKEGNSQVRSEAKPTPQKHQTASPLEFASRPLGRGDVVHNAPKEADFPAPPQGVESKGIVIPPSADRAPPPPLPGVTIPRPVVEAPHPQVPTKPMPNPVVGPYTIPPLTPRSSIKKKKSPRDRDEEDPDKDRETD